MNSIGPVMQAGVSFSHLKQALCHSIMFNEARTAKAHEAELHVTFLLQPWQLFTWLSSICNGLCCII
jgi:hypothetical protein